MMITRLFLLALLLPCTMALAAEEGKPYVELNTIRLFVPTPELEKRLGTDVTPIGEYIKALVAATGKIVGQEKTAPTAKGLYLAIGIKSGKRSKAWCEALEGDAGADLLRKIETELARVSAIEVKAPVAFALELKVHGQKPKEYPAVPKAWQEAIKKSDHEVVIAPPDEVFKLVWPEEP